MKIKQVHAHFLVSIGNYSNERIGFSVELDESETPEQVVSKLRQKAIDIIGKEADDLYREKFSLEHDIRELREKAFKARQEWDATAEFLKAQGLRPDAPKMPQFNNLLTPKVEEESVTEGELVDQPF